MTTKAIIQRVRAACRRFAGDREGNTLVTFALAFVPLVGLMGAAVDYSRAYSIQTSMQAAADTTALMVAQSATSESATDLQTQVSNYYRALFTRNDATNLQVVGTHTTANGSTVVVTASATYKTSFMGVLGFSTLPLSASSTASYGNLRLRVALILDNTGSMASSGKLTALKNALNQASTGLLAQLKAAAMNNGDVYVSIIPFVKDVNVDPSNNAADWIYWDDTAHSDNTSWDALNGSCSSGSFHDRNSCVTSSGGTCSLSGFNSQSSCTSAGTCSISGYNTKNSCLAAVGACSISSFTTQTTCQSGGTCSISGHTSQSSCTSAHVCSDPSRTTKTQCQNHGDTWLTGVWTTGVWTVATWTAGVWTPPTWTPNAHTTWNGCVMDRGDPGAPNSGNYDTNSTAPSTSNTATQYAAEQYSACPQAVMGLSYDWTSMTSEVNNMVANGNTNQAVGLQLGWMSLVGGGPFTMPAEDPSYVYSHVIILLSDGLNTQNRWYTSATSIDARQRMTCDNIKSAGITIYTVQVNTDGEATSSVLQYCAGNKAGVADSSKFFLLTSSTQIVSTFQQIGTQLSKLRIAK
jgi:Flp pilus assembly protein TadG